MPCGLQRLRRSDIGELVGLLEEKPLHNIFLLSRLVDSGFNIERLGCPVYGFWRNGCLSAVCHDGNNIVLATRQETLSEAETSSFVNRLGPIRNASAIVGTSQNVELVFTELSLKWPASWARPRDIRQPQLLLAINQPSNIEPDDRVFRVSRSYFRPYFEAAVKMYTEELGQSPLDDHNSYQHYVSSLINQQRAFGAYHRGLVWFKTDIGCRYKKFCQIQGVWLDPALRGKKIAARAMAQVLKLCETEYDVVSLYVNHYNTKARKLYASLGFHEVGSLATVLY